MRTEGAFFSLFISGHSFFFFFKIKFPMLFWENMTFAFLVCVLVFLVDFKFQGINLILFDTIQRYGKKTTFFF